MQLTVKGFASVGALMLVLAAGAALADTPVAPTRIQGDLAISCGASGNGTKWGSLRIKGESYPFGTKAQPWTVWPDIGVSALGEHLLLLDIHTPKDRTLQDYADEPAYTLRIGDHYRLTPPIAPHDYVRAHRSDARDAARDKAEAEGKTFCYLGECFISDAEKAFFFKAFNETAAAGGDLVVQGPGPSGPIEVVYSLKGLDGILGRLGACVK